MRHLTFPAVCVSIALAALIGENHKSRAQQRDEKEKDGLIARVKELEQSLRELERKLRDIDANQRYIGVVTFRANFTGEPAKTGDEKVQYLLETGNRPDYNDKYDAKKPTGSPKYWREAVVRDLPMGIKILGAWATPVYGFRDHKQILLFNPVVTSDGTGIVVHYSMGADFKGTLPIWSINYVYQKLQKGS